MNPKYLMQPLFHSMKNEDLFLHLLNDIDWLEETPSRKEYFMADKDIVYSYGVEEQKIGDKKRSYRSSPYTQPVQELQNILNEMTNAHYNVCFLNRYDSARMALGWHADDSPEMNPQHPIAVVSFGAVREIWWKEKGMKGEVAPENRQRLEDGSVFIMPSGFQDLYFHRIPKSDRPCSTRVSLTFRNYI